MLDHFESTSPKGPTKCAELLNFNAKRRSKKPHFMVIRDLFTGNYHSAITSERQLVPIVEDFRKLKSFSELTTPFWAQAKFKKQTIAVFPSGYNYT